MSLKKNGLWIVFFGFVLAAILTHQGEHLFLSQNGNGLGKAITWFLFLSFLAYSIYCSYQENIFRTIKRIYPYHWARQIGLDLYIGITISSCIIYLNEGSFLVLAFWLVPLILFANLTTLLYFAMNFDSIVARFI